MKFESFQSFSIDVRGVRIVFWAQRLLNFVLFVFCCVSKGGYVSLFRLRTGSYLFRLFVCELRKFKVNFSITWARRI